MDLTKAAAYSDKTLDTGTPCATDNVYNTRGNDYQTRLESKNVLFPAESATVLDLMSNAALGRNFERQSSQAPEPRDAKFASLVLDKINQGSGGWAIVIVGANHATGIPESMRSRLTDAGIECRVDWIKPNGPVPA